MRCTLKTHTPGVRGVLTQGYDTNSDPQFCKHSSAAIDIGLAHTPNPTVRVADTAYRCSISLPVIIRMARSTDHWSIRRDICAVPDKQIQGLGGSNSSITYSSYFCKISDLTFRWSEKKKWNESGFRPPLCTYRLNWARRTSWGWWDDWDDTVLQTQDSKFEPWRSEAEHATSRSRRLPTILTFTRGWGRNIFCFFQTAESGNRTPNSGVKGSLIWNTNGFSPNSVCLGSLFKADYPNFAC